MALYFTISINFSLPVYDGIIKLAIEHLTLSFHTKVSISQPSTGCFDLSKEFHLNFAMVNRNKDVDVTVSMRKCVH